MRRGGVGRWLNLARICHSTAERVSSLASYLACIDECTSERECRKFEEGLDNKVKLAMYKKFAKRVEFKKYICMAKVMQELDSCLSLGLECII